MIDPQVIVRSVASELAHVAADINMHHETISRLIGESIEHARQAGELLLKAKADLPHGQFTPWIKASCQFSERTARNYMAVASNWTKIEQERQRAAGLDSVREAIKFLAAPEPDEEPAEKPLVDIYREMRRHDLGEHTLEDWEPRIGEAVLGLLPDGRHLLLESCGDKLTHVRTACFDDDGVTFTKRGINRQVLFFNLWHMHGITDISTVDWFLRCPATLEGNPLAEFMLEDWSYSTKAGAE